MGQHNHFGCMYAYACMGVPIFMYVCMHACMRVLHASMGVCACMVCASVVRMRMHGLCYGTVHSDMAMRMLVIAWHVPMPFTLSCHA